MASWFLLSVGLFIAFYSGSNGENCSLALAALQSNAFDTDTDFSNVISDCPALQKLLEERENLAQVREENSRLKILLSNVTTESNSTLHDLVQEFYMNLTRIQEENEQLREVLLNFTTELASNSIIPTPEAVIVHTEHNENLTLNCSIVIPQRYQDVSISLVRDGEDMPTDWHGADVTARNVTNPGLQMWYRVFDRCHPVPLNLTGDFTCVMHAASPASSASPASYSTAWTIAVVVHEPLNVEGNLEEVETTEGREVNITCNVSGNPIPKEVTWSFKTKAEATFQEILRSDSTYKQTSGPDMEYSRAFNLMIMKPTTAMDGYEYNCSARDSIMDESVSSAVTLLVKKKDAANIQIIQNPNPAPINEIVTLNCSATSEENIDEIKWKYNNKNMNEHTPGVLDLPLPQIDGSVGFSILKLSIKDNDGKNRPRKVICIVELVPNAQGNKPTVSKPYEVNITDAVIPHPSPTSSSAATPTPTAGPTTSAATPNQGNSVGVTAVAVAIVVVVVISGIVLMVYWKRHMLRDWLMEKDVVKVMQKGKRGKGYKYSKLPKDVSTSMKHLE